MFDAQQYLESIDHPTFIDPTGRKHVGRILGADHWLRLQLKLRRCRKINEDGSETWDAAGLDRAMKEIVRAVFPTTWYKPWEKSVRHWLWKLPSIGRARAVWDFLQSLAKAMGEEVVPFPGTFLTDVLPSRKAADPSPALPTPASSPGSTVATPATITTGAPAGSGGTAA